MKGILSYIMIIISVTASDHFMDLIENSRRFDRADIDSMQELPEANAFLPGHSLLRPSKTMLKSAAKYPQDNTNIVYGNMDNVDITDGKTKDRVLYTAFRKGNNIELEAIIKAIQKYNQNTGNKRKQAVIIINSKPEIQKNNITKSIQIENYLNNEDFAPEEQNDASEILDSSAEADEHFRRTRTNRKTKPKYRDRNVNYNSSMSSSSTSSTGSSHYEKNVGNPYTIFKNKYRQNWLWNHFMDGDHMNINPYGPKLHEMGPTGAQLFFNRKWWYFNQDDYKPMG